MSINQVSFQFEARQGSISSFIENAFRLFENVVLCACDIYWPLKMFDILHYSI